MKVEGPFVVTPKDPVDAERARRVQDFLDWLYNRPLTEGTAFLSCLALIVRMWAVRMERERYYDRMIAAYFRGHTPVLPLPMDSILIRGEDIE